MTMPWESHRHRKASKPDAEGDYLCVVCDLCMEGPAADEAREMLGLLNRAIGRPPR